MILYICLILLIGVIAAFFILNQKEDAIETYIALKEEGKEEINFNEKPKEEVHLNRDQKILFGILFVIFIFFAQIFLSTKPIEIVISCVFSLSISYIIVRYVATKDFKKMDKKLDFYLPIVMERLVMAVQGGADIFTAVNVIVKLSKEKGEELDPVTKILEDVINKTEAGISFEEALNQVAMGIKLTSIRHAFLHLGIAQKEGGEVIPPMEELSDSTQNYYQEVVENEIAALPVKATIPLLCSFLGLILFFLAVPMVQFLKQSMQVKL